MSDAARLLSRGLVATLTLDQWRLFIQIADLGSLTKVAALRDGAQSAVSRQLAAMEQPAAAACSCARVAAWP